MSEPLLDRLSREHSTDVRRWLAQLIVVGGATRAQAVQKLEEKFGASVTTRSITTWQNKDTVLVAMIRELEEAKREVSGDADQADVLANIPEPVNRAQADADIMEMAEQFPAFADLMHRAVEAEEATKPETTAWGVPTAPAADVDDADDSAWADVHAALTATEHRSDAEFEAECRRRLDGWEPPPPTPKHGAGALKGD